MCTIASLCSIFLPLQHKWRSFHLTLPFLKALYATFNCRNWIQRELRAKWTENDKIYQLESLNRHNRIIHKLTNIAIVIISRVVKLFIIEAIWLISQTITLNMNGPDSLEVRIPYSSLFSRKLIWLFIL